MGDFYYPGVLHGGIFVCLLGFVGLLIYITPIAYGRESQSAFSSIVFIQCLKAVVLPVLAGDDK